MVLFQNHLNCFFLASSPWYVYCRSHAFSANCLGTQKPTSHLFFQLFPLFFVLMSDKKTKTYEKVFKYIEDNVWKFQPAQFMTDFESGLRKAISSYFPNAPLYGCWYHYSVSIRRRLMTLNMYRVITDDPAGLMIYRMFLSLPLLPQERILDGFNFIKNEARKNGLFKEFREFFKYFDNFWIHLVCFHAKDLCVFYEQCNKNYFRRSPKYLSIYVR